MLLIPCPWCGPRDVTEFIYAGDAAHQRPADPAAMKDADWNDFVFIRGNPRGRHVEWWQHSAGCRRYLRLTRDTRTHEIFDSAPPHGPGPSA